MLCLSHCSMVGPVSIYSASLTVCSSISNESTGSFVEFYPILQLFREEYTPETLPFHLIVPSLPGYTFSSGPPLDKNFGLMDNARVVDQLMKDLGFGSGYVIQGGDIGSFVGRLLGVSFDACKG